MSRIPDEMRIDSGELDRLEAIFADAETAYASVLLADRLGEPDAVIEAWIDQLYNNLRAALGPEDRLRAVVYLLRCRAERRSRRTLTMLEGSW